MKKPRLYIGIEIKVREFDAKLLLACVAAEAGYTVILGQQRVFKRRLEEMPRGIYLDKSVATAKAQKHLRLQNLVFKWLLMMPKVWRLKMRMSIRNDVYLRRRSNT